MIDNLPFLQQPWIIQIGGTLIGVFVGFLLGATAEKWNRFRRFTNHKSAVRDEKDMNELTMRQIIAGLDDNKFTVDGLSCKSVDALLAQADVYEFDRQRNLIYRILVYEKTVKIANATIDFCSSQWRKGVHHDDSTTWEKNKNALREKLQHVRDAACKLEKYLPQGG